ncbi:MAG: SPFH/Band 7/PHB domain protein, partial [Coriobacteriia bacterium]|nr:SPFH/Band 7/PHB domain protein [Coriobacteriia bacterium]
GVRVVRVELQRIEPPVDVTEAMHRQMKAERTRRALILEAEGQAQAIKNVAEAEKFQRIALAEGEALAIKSVFSAIHEGDPTNDVIAIRYLEALKSVANGAANKVFLPMEVSGILGSIGGIGELFKEKAEGA